MKNILYIIALIATLTSCATTRQFVQLPDSNAKVNNDALIYVLRPATMGAAIKFKIYQDGKPIGELGPKSYLKWMVKPNDKGIIITSESENVANLTFRPQPGKVYYIKQKVKMGIVIARTKLIFLDNDEGKEILKKLKKPQVKITEQSVNNESIVEDEILYLNNGSEIHGTIITIVPNEAVTIRTVINNVFVNKVIDIKDIKIDSTISKTVYLKNGSIINGKIIEFELGKHIKIKTTDNNVFVYEMDEVKEITIDPK